MITTVNSYDFHDAFRQAGRQGQFSYEGLNVLFDYLEQCEEDIGEQIEFDVVALCCDYVESSIEGVIGYYNIDIEDCQGDEEEEN